MTPLGYQLYSSRHFPISETMPMLAEIGYGEVEGFGALFQDADALRSVKDGIETHGLTMPTAHFGIDMVRDDPANVIAICKDLGIKSVVYPFLMPDERPTDAQGWDALGHALGEFGKPVLDAGLDLAWHNHDFEFTDLGVPETPLDLLMQAAPHMQLELDLAWVHKGNRDPLEFVARYSDRMLVAHLKDIAPDGSCMDEDGWADLGHGVMDWPTLYAALKKTTVRHMVAEHDNPSDHRRFAQRSFDTVAQF